MNIEQAKKELLDIKKSELELEKKNFDLLYKYVEILNILNDNDMLKLKQWIYEKFMNSDYAIFVEYSMSIVKGFQFKQKLELKEIEKKNLNILNFYQEYDPCLIAYIKGHLFLENVFNKILEKNNFNINKTFFQKIQLLYKNKNISKNMKILLENINKIRNNIAHDLYYDLEFEEVFKLIKLSVNAGIIYSDDTIWKNIYYSKEFYGVKVIIDELFVNTFSKLFEDNNNLFEIDEFYNFIL